jgi:hypothetical protein
MSNTPAQMDMFDFDFDFGPRSQGVDIIIERMKTNPEEFLDGD